MTSGRQVTRVAYDSQIFAQQQFGGISRYFCELAKCVAQASGFDSRVVAPLHRNQHLLDSKDLNRGVLFNPAGRVAGKLMRMANQLISPWQLRDYAPDILHETYYLESNRIGVDCPRVVTVFDMINERLEPETSDRDKLTRAKRASVARADSVICISEHTRRDLIDLLGVPEAKTHVVHLGFTLTAVPAADCQAETRRPFLLHVGKRDGYKNFDTLLAAFASSARLRSNFSLLAFGGGGFSEKEHLRIAELGLKSGEVVQTGGQDDVLSALYRDARCFIYPSMYEGFGIPPLEAMSFGCPVVSGNTSSIPEVVGDAAITVDPTDVDAMREAIERAAFDEDVRRDLVSRGATRIRQFSWVNCAEETMKIYQSLL
jgi:glycosyltransferase involved in cell wall biosynthesis